MYLTLQYLSPRVDSQGEDLQHGDDAEQEKQIRSSSVQSCNEYFIDRLVEAPAEPSTQSKLATFSSGNFRFTEALAVSAKPIAGGVLI